MPKLKEIKSGKIKRHQMRKTIGLKSGFGKPWSAPSVTFRVECNWENLDGSETNEQIHWVECRKFQGKERELFKIHYDRSVNEWIPGETIESKFVCVYCAEFLTRQRKKLEEYWRDQIFAVSNMPEIPAIDDFIWEFDFFADEPPSSLLTAIAPDSACKKIKNFPLEYFSLPSASMVNQAFVFPSSKKGNETIRSPIYRIKWSEEIAENAVFTNNLAIVMKNSIWHKL
jgi:hypothetical protein